MGRIDNIIDRARNIENPPPTKLEQYALENEYMRYSWDELIELLGEPHEKEEFHKITFALVWKGGRCSDG